MSVVLDPETTNQLSELQPDPAAHPAKGPERRRPRSGSGVAPEAPAAAALPAGAPAAVVATGDAADRGGQRVPERRRRRRLPHRHRRQRREVLLDAADGDGVLFRGVARLAQRFRVLHEARRRQHQWGTLPELVR